MYFYVFLRLLLALVGTPHCPICGKEIKQQTIDQIIDQVLELPEATRIQVMAPVIRGKKGEHAKVFEDARRSGYVRCRVDGIAYDLSEEIKLEKNKKHNIEIVVDRLVIREDIARRLTDSVEIASNLSGGLVVVIVVGEDRDILFSQNYACEDCGTPINPNLTRVQTEGGILQGIGMALTENITYDAKGWPMENSFMQYKIPARVDIGHIRVEFESSYEPNGPFGAKSIGEVVINTPLPAIADAIYNAIGTRFYELPIPPEQVAMAVEENR